MDKKSIKLGIVKVLFFAVFLFGFNNLYGQMQDLASLTIEQCLKYAEEKRQAGDIREATFFLNAAAEKYWDKKDYSNAIKYYHQSVELNKTIPNWNGIAGINSNLGLIYYDLDDFEKSYEYLKQTYTYRKEQGDKPAVISAIINMSVALNKMGRYSEAIKVLEESVEVARELNNFEQLRSCYGMLSETYTKAGNTEKAAEIFHLYKAVHDALLKDSEKRVSEAAIKAQLAEKERGLAEAERELAEAKRRYADYELAGMSKALEGLDSKNRELLESKTRAELIIENLKDKEIISELEKKEIETRLEAEKAKSRVLIVIQFATIIVVIVIGFFLWQKKKDNRKLAQQNVLINHQKSDLEAAFMEIRHKNNDLIEVNESLAATQKELKAYQKELEERVVARTSQLLKALDKARESDRLKSAFFANLSHEIRTPFNAILGFSQMFDNPGISVQKRTMMSTMVKTNAVQLMRLVEDIVTLSEIDSELITIQPQICDIHQMLNAVTTEATQMIQLENKEKLEIILDNRFPETVQNILIDGKKISRILSHLVENAIKCTDNGYIVLGCETPKEKTLRFWVEDTGMGIEAEDFDSIFKRFWKQGDAFTQKSRGLGIGLSLCKELIELMNGQISVSSTAGYGSTFDFTINY